jgi:molybdate transport system substrate-binding protein
VKSLALLLALTALGGAKPTVYAAASLTDVLPRIQPAARYQFAGSDQLAYQIQQGAPADLFLAASPKYPDQLYAQGLVEKPVVFATNRVVLIVPRANPARIMSVYDLRRDGIKLVIGAKGVPIGDYTRKLLANLGLSSVLSNVVSEEDDVKLVVAKVALGEADAGFVYRTDVKPVGTKVLRIGIPAAGQPTVAYEAAIVKAGSHKAEARALLRRLLAPAGRERLRDAGFGLP